MLREFICYNKLPIDYYELTDSFGKVLRTAVVTVRTVFVAFFHWLQTTNGLARTKNGGKVRK